MKMTYDRLSAIVQRKTLRPKKTCAIIKRGRSTSSSFAPFTIQQAGNITHIKINPSVTDVSVSGGNYKFFFVSCITHSKFFACSLQYV
ncbi:unnamed protein product [Thelazia callipaeda]|uniref:MSP domain-containing protein n=1 Tax=Thelazia callipaeda TaxID=103827 RepID=A0A0N5D8X4_THECL|nr:unnamed protein product [Thelazia callipaeda]